MVDPKFRTPYFDQWNGGIERQLPGNLALDANYVGSNGRHEDWGPVMNVPQPGPGNIQDRRPFPYMQEQWFDQSVGDSRYNAMQVTLNERGVHGVGFLVAYTVAHSNSDGCNLGASCHSSTRRMRFRRHSRGSHHSTILPVSSSPMWLVDGRLAAWCSSVRGRTSR